MWSKGFWKATFERVVATGAEVAGAVLVVDGVGIHELDWEGGLSLVAAAMLGSLIKNIGAAARDGNPSVASLERVKEQ